MAERYPGRIYIGGTLSPELIPQLKEAMEVAPEEDELLWSTNTIRPFEGQEEQDHGITAPDDTYPGTLCIYDVYARNGEFPELVQFCQDHDLAYVMEADAGAEYEAVMYWWDPRKGYGESTLCSNQGEPFTNTKTALRLMDDLLQRAADGYLSTEEERTAARTTVKEQLKLPPETLPPFVIKTPTNTEDPQ